MSSTDLTPPATTTDAPAAPFVRVYLDRDTGRAVIALDRDAVDRLTSYLDDIGPGYDLSMNPGFYGLDDATAIAVADVISRISGPLNALYR
jgi:hypothetical protein